MIYYVVKYKIYVNVIYNQYIGNKDEDKPHRCELVSLRATTYPHRNVVATSPTELIAINSFYIKFINTSVRRIYILCILEYR